MCAAQMAGNWTRAYTNHVPLYAPYLNRDGCDDSLWAASASSYAERSGWFWITLAPDAEQATDTFPSAADALRALKPAVRVGVNRFGDVRVVPISALMPADIADAYQLDPVLRGPKWDDQAALLPLYQRNQRTDAAGDPLGIPADGFLTQEMLEQRVWWLIPR
jgi:hypothetical protein